MPLSFSFWENDKNARTVQRGKQDLSLDHEDQLFVFLCAVFSSQYIILDSITLSPPNSGSNDAHCLVALYNIAGVFILLDYTAWIIVSYSLENTVILTVSVILSHKEHEL